MYGCKISIIVPVYNVGHYINECIESVRKQTYKNIQIILVDDGSTDESGRICDRHAETDKRIIVIHQQNKGLVAARKSGLAIADGEYIGFVDGDDFIEAEMYEELITELVNAQADVIHTGYWFGAKSVVGFKRTCIREEKEREDFLKTIIRGESSVMPSIWSKLFKAELIKKCYSDVRDTVSYGEDLVCMCSILLHPVKVLLMDRAFYHYRMREDSISHEIGEDKIRQEVDLYENICCILDGYNNYVKFVPEMNWFLFNHILIGLRKTENTFFIMPTYYFPEPEKLQDKKILLYGAGNVGMDYYTQISRYKNCEIIAWVDAYPEKCQYPCIQVSGVETILTKEFDLIVIAVNSEQTALDINQRLKQYGIDNSKIHWVKPKKYIWN